MIEDFEKLNLLYKPLCARADKIKSALNNANLKAVSGFFNGHYIKDGEGWVKEYFPIPVISVDGLCDIEIDFNFISISSKLKKAAALCFDYSQLKGEKFEIYGVENYLADIFNAETPASDICKNIEKSGEGEIGFSFFKKAEDSANEILKTIMLLKKHGFYY